MEFTPQIVGQMDIWQRFWEVLTTPGLSMFLLIGSVVLALALLVLTVTRWGHARPITKCVILSVIAHILLLGYAYGTRMMFNYPVVNNPAPVQVNLIEYEYDDEAPVEEENNDSVDRFATEILETETNSLQRPVPESPFELERVFQNESVTTQPLDRMPPLVDIAQLDSQQPDFQIGENNDFPSQQESFEPLQIEPVTPDFQRRGAGENDIREHAPETETAPDSMQPAPPLSAFEMQPKLIDNNSIPTTEQTTSQFESELVIPDAQDSLVDDFAARAGIDPPVGVEPPASLTLSHPEQNEETAIAETTDRNQEHFDNRESVPPVNPAQLLQSANSTRRLADGKPMPVIYRLRKIDNRREVAKLRGGTDATENAVEAALAWLASCQKENGSWCPAETGGGREDKVYGHDRGGCGANSEMGITALATLTFLGAGHSHLEGQYQHVVQKSLEYIIRNQSIDGDLSGNAKLFARMYCHSMSLLAISEALAITGDRRLKSAVQLGVNFTVAAQDKTGGGWRYQAGDRGDMSQFGWIVLALHTAETGGVEIGESTRARMLRFLRSCQTGKKRGLASYRPGEGPSTTMTAEALLCTYFLGAPLDPDAFAEAKQRIMTELPRTSSTNLYFWYYGTLALNQQQDSEWDAWNQALQQALLSSQEKNGRFSGSWRPDGLWAGYGGRVYSTAMATLNLQAYYRYLPANEIRQDQAMRIERRKGPDLLR